MNATEYLSQVYRLNERIDAKVFQLDQLKSLAENVNGLNTSPVVSHTPDPTAMQNTILRIMEAEQDLNRQIDELVALRVEVTDTINEIDSLKLRLVLEWKDVCLMTYEHIANRMHYCTRYVQDLHRQGVEALQAILDARHDSGGDPAQSQSTLSA